MLNIDLYYIFLDESDKKRQTTGSDMDDEDD